MIIKLLVDGGEMKPGPTVGQKLGPIGINIGNVIGEVNKATAGFKGTKVPVSLDVDAKTKTFKIEVFSPPASELLKKEASIETGSGDHKKNKVANVSIESVIKVAKVKFPNMLAKEFKSAVKSIIGSCTSLGILVENKVGTEAVKDVEKGIFDSEIKEQKSEVSAEKKAKLKEHFDKVLADQEAAKKAEEAVKAAEEAAKLAEAAATPEAAKSEGEEESEEKAPIAGAKPGEAPKTAAPAKGKEEKKKK